MAGRASSALICVALLALIFVGSSSAATLAAEGSSAPRKLLNEGRVDGVGTVGGTIQSEREGLSSTGFRNPNELFRNNEVLVGAFGGIFGNAVSSEAERLNAEAGVPTSPP
jgi:hypothetical protein